MRDARPDIAFSSDFIVGFPGESEDDFRATLSLVDEVGYASAFSFKYSPRPGTPAAEMDDQVPDEVKSERLYRLQAAIDRQQAAFNRAMSRPHLRRPVRKAGTLSWPDRRPLPISPAGSGHGAPDNDRRHRSGDGSRDRAPTACSARSRKRVGGRRTDAGGGLNHCAHHDRTTGLSFPRQTPRRQCRNADRARLRRQPARLPAVRPIRAEPGADRA